MRTITQTTRPPPCLATQPPDQDWYTFMQTPCRSLVANSLREEQHHLCCYCESEIDQVDGHIEHLVPRSRATTKIYDYSNLAMSCNGRDGNKCHCGHRKGHDYDPTLFVSPHDQAAERLFRYVTDGSIVPADPQHPERADYMRSILALDCASLTGRRMQHARLLIKTLGPKPTPDLVDWVRSYYLQPDNNGKLRQFHSLSRTLLS